MGALLGTFAMFLAEHWDLVNAIWEAMDGGAKKADIMKAIRQTQIDATNAAVAADLGPRPAQ